MMSNHDATVTQPNIQNEQDLATACSSRGSDGLHDG